MIRHCDGNDPFLGGQDGKPCTCGATFDDVDHRVIYPHEHFEKLTVAQLEEILRNTPTPPF